MARRTSAPRGPSGSAAARADLIADTALTLLAERGMRGLTHRAVDALAGLPQGSTSNHFRTRQALLEASVRRLAEREASLLALEELPAPGAPGGPDALADALARTLHRSLTGDRALTLARYELALEATRRPELRAYYDTAGRRFRGPVSALVAAAGSPDPERHALALIAWAEGMLFACTAGSHHGEVPGPAELRAGFAELLGGMLGPHG